MGAPAPFALAIVRCCRLINVTLCGVRNVPFNNLVTRGVYRLASGTRVSDTQTGLRAFSARLIDFLVAIGGERYEYEMNVLLACPSHHVPIREVPIKTIYEDGNSTSHFRPMQDSLRIYGDILAFVASSLASFLVDFALFGMLSGLMAA